VCVGCEPCSCEEVYIHPDSHVLWWPKEREGELMEAKQIPLRHRQRLLRRPVIRIQKVACVPRGPVPGRGAGGVYAASLAGSDGCAAPVGRRGQDRGHSGQDAAGGELSRLDRGAFGEAGVLRLSTGVGLDLYTAKSLFTMVYAPGYSNSLSEAKDSCLITDFRTSPAPASVAAGGGFAPADCFASAGCSPATAD
jgi:hypothetical protein